MKKFLPKYSAFFVSTVALFVVGFIGVVVFYPEEEVNTSSTPPQSPSSRGKEIQKNNIVKNIIFSEKEEKKISLQKFKTQKTEIQNKQVSKIVKKIVEKNTTQKKISKTPIKNFSQEEQQEQQEVSTFEVERVQKVSEEILALTDRSDFFPNYTEEVKVEIKKYKEAKDEAENITKEITVGAQNLVPKQKQIIKKKYIATSSARIKSLEGINQQIKIEHQKNLEEKIIESVGAQNLVPNEIKKIAENLQSTVADLEPNYVYELFGDPKSDEQWAVDFVLNNNVGATHWVAPTETNDEIIIVAVIDTGTDIFHEDLKDNI